MRSASPITAMTFNRLPPALALLPLRLFLGITFVYAGIQKLADPGYLHPGAPTYIGTQLHNFAHGTPGGFLLRAFAEPIPRLTGVAVALLEILVGLLMTAGLLTRGAAAAGLLLNLVLFLTNSWKTYPYFLGSDIVFVFAWLPFVLTGATGQPALEHQLDRLATRWGRGRRGAGLGGGVATRPRATPGGGVAGAAVSRREVLGRALGAAGLATAFLGGMAALTKGSYRNQRTLGSIATGPSKPAATTATQPPSPTQTTASATPPGAVRLGPSSALGRNQGALYRDPGDGNPDLIIRHQDGSLTAMSAICTHQGCTVGYSGDAVVCPCHGGVYNPSTGAVESGPPPTPLALRRVVERGGQIYALPA